MKAEAELPKISDDIPECEPDRDVRPGGAHEESQGKISENPAASWEVQKGQVHLDGC